MSSLPGVGICLAEGNKLSAPQVCADAQPGGRSHPQLPADARGPLPDTKPLLSKVIEAVRSFNASKTGHKHILGFWAVNLLNGVTPAQLAQLFSEVL
jgi:hypothetical protein